jgi:hypothetical protein
VTLDRAVEDDLYELFKAHYGSPKGFHKDCKTRHTDFQSKNALPESWSDACLTPILVMDYYDPNKHGGRLVLPQVPNMSTYAGY